MTINRLTISMVSGQTWALIPISMTRMPSFYINQGLWPLFQQSHIPGTQMSEEESDRLQAFMRLHKTEALRHESTPVTLAGGMFAHCNPVAFENYFKRGW